jgi:hypothetical protein
MTKKERRKLKEIYYSKTNVQLKGLRLMKNEEWKFGN